MMGSMMRRAMLGDGSTLSLDFTTGVLDSRLTFTRASTGTFINASGNVATASNNVARFDHDPTTLAPRGLLIEGTATNLALNSETFPTSGTGLWSYEDVTANATKITAPDGTTNAIQFNETTANNVHRIGQSVSASAGSVSVSVWVKVLQPGTPRRLFINANTFMNARGLFDIDPAIQTGASGTAVSVTGTAANKAGTWIKYPNDWYRCTLIGTYSTSSTVYLQINRASSSTATDDIFAGSTTNGLAIWGAQAETASGASSYIPTGASTATRVADTAIIAAGSAFTSWYTGNTDGTFYADWHGGVRSTTGTNRTVFSTSDVVNRHFHMMQTAAAGNLRVSDFGASSSVTTANAMTSGARTKGAFSFNGGNVKLCLNGGTVASGGVVFTTAPTWLVIGGTSTNGTSITDANVLLNGCVRQIKYWPTILTDAQLQSFTT